MRIVALALLLLAVSTGCGSTDEQAAPPEQTTVTESGPQTSQRPAAPPISGESLDGEPIALGDFRGQPVLVNVWSSW